MFIFRAGATADFFAPPATVTPWSTDLSRLDCREASALVDSFGSETASRPTACSRAPNPGSAGRTGGGGGLSSDKRALASVVVGFGTTCTLGLVPKVVARRSKDDVVSCRFTPGGGGGLSFDKRGESMDAIVGCCFTTGQGCSAIPMVACANRSTPMAPLTPPATEFSVASSATANWSTIRFKTSLAKKR